MKNEHDDAGLPKPPIPCVPYDNRLSGLPLLTVTLVRLISCFHARFFTPASGTLDVPHHRIRLFSLANAFDILLDPLAQQHSLSGRQKIHCSDDRSTCSCVPLSQQHSLARPLFAFSDVGMFIEAQTHSKNTFLPNQLQW